MFQTNTNVMPALPYPYDRPVSPYLNIGPNNPPFVPQIQHLPELMQALGYISGSLAKEIQDSATLGPLRMFMFNQYSENNYSNNAFASLVLGVCDWMMMAVGLRQFPNYESALPPIVTEAVTMMGAVNLRNFAALEQVINPNSVPTLREYIQKYDQLSQQISSFKARMQGPNNMAGNMGGGTGWGWAGGPAMQQQSWNNYGGGNQGGWNQGGGWNQNRGTGGSWAQQLAGTGSATHGVFSTGGGGRMPGQVGNAQASTRDFGGSAAAAAAPQAGQLINFAGSPAPAPAAPSPQAVAQQPSTPAAAAQATAAPAEIMSYSAVGKWEKWTPTKEQPYLPVFNPATHELIFSEDTNGKVTYNLKQRNNEVDPNRHSTATIFGTSVPVEGSREPTEVLAKVAEGVEQLNRQLDGKVDAETSDAPALPTPLKQDRAFYAITEQAGIFMMSLERLALSKGERPMVFFSFLQSCEPVVCSKNENERIEEYGQCGNFLKLRELMMEDAQTMFRQLWVHLHTRATEMVNRILSQNLSLPELNIDSYVDDITDLLPYLKNTYGDNVYSAFMRHEAEMIRAAFGVMMKKQMEEWDEEFLEVERFNDGEVPFIAYPAHWTMALFLNCNGQELGIEMAPGVASVVDAKATPVIHAAIDAMFMEAKNGRRENFYKYLVVLDDGHHLEATRGFLLPDSYLLTVVR